MKKQGLPSFQQLRDFLHSQKRRIYKRDIIRYFNIKGEEDKVQLRTMLHQMMKDETFQRKRHSFFSSKSTTEQTLVEIVGVNKNGELIASFSKENAAKTNARIILKSKDRLTPSPTIGDKVFAKIWHTQPHLYEGEVVKYAEDDFHQMVAVFQAGKLVPIDKRIKKTFHLNSSFPELKLNDLVMIEVSRMHTYTPQAQFIKKIGKSTDAHVASLISIFEHQLPIAFTKQSLQQAKQAKVPPLENRTDLRNIPFVTIDGADAKDFDDAVFAEPDTNKGWHIYVSIADVAYFVLFGTALDKDAYLRGNSTYFPDRTLPMLPENLSNGICSLNPLEDRPCLTAEIWIDKNGKAQKHRFLRTMIHSKRRLTYDEVESDFTGQQKIEGLGQLMDSLKGAYEALLKERIRRGVLEIDVPERQVILDDKGNVLKIAERQRFTSHKMIEEFMILANVAAAQTLEKLGLPTMYRVHDSPSEEKMANLNLFLSEKGFKQHIKSTPQPSDFNQLISSSKKDTISINEMILRAQSQAIYSPENRGHFGLALQKYGHFTSPIRRYADILIHRALIKGLKLGTGALSTEESLLFEKMATHISATERNSASAEQDTMDRYIASFLAHKVGNEFEARISSVTNFGLFVCLDAYGADGLIPLSSLKNDFYIFDEKLHRLRGERTKIAYTIGQEIQVVLKEALPLTGGLIFSIVENTKKTPKKRQKTKRFNIHLPN